MPGDAARATMPAETPLGAALVALARGLLRARPMMDRRRIAGVLVALLASGCFGDGGSQGCMTGNGIVGTDAFSYECRSEADAFCSGAELQTSGFSRLPSAVARGAWFGLDVASSQRKVSPVSARTVKTDAGRWFRTTRAGSIGFLSEYDDELVDALRLTSVEPTSLRLERAEAGYAWGEGTTFTVQIAVGSPVRVRAIPRGTVFGVERDLAGALAVDFTTDDPDVTPEGDGYGVVIVTPRRAGKLLVRASFEGRLQAETTLVVVGSSSGGVDAGTKPVSDAGEDASADGGGP